LNISAKNHQNQSYNSELYRFKVGAFFETQCTLLATCVQICSSREAAPDDYLHCSMNNF